MAVIDDPRAVRFANEALRPEADLLVSLYFGAKALLAAYQAQGLSALFPPDPTAHVADGSPADGRPPLSGLQVVALVAGLQSMVTQAETPDPQTGIKLIDIIVGTAVNYRHG